MTFKCNYKPEPTNGHWHTSQEEAKRCINSWTKWNNPTKSQSLLNKRLIANKPHGTLANDNRKE
jgi:hypothetical protein